MTLPEIPVRGRLPTTTPAARHVADNPEFRVLLSPAWAGVGRSVANRPSRRRRRVHGREVPTNPIAIGVLGDLDRRGVGGGLRIRGTLPVPGEMPRPGDRFEGEGPIKGPKLPGLDEFQAEYEGWRRERGIDEPAYAWGRGHYAATFGARGLRVVRGVRHDVEAATDVAAVWLVGVQPRGHANV